MEAYTPKPFKILTFLLVKVVLSGLLTAPSTAFSDQPSEQMLSDMYEELQIVPENSAAGKLFSKYLRDLISNIFEDAHVKGLQDVQFLLSTRSDQVARYVTVDRKFLGVEASKKFIILSFGDLKSYQYEDQLAWVLNHEWFHHLVRKEGVANNKVEEGATDNVPLSRLLRAGYNLDKIAEYVESILQENRGGIANIKFGRILDDHLLDHNRIKLIFQHIGKLSFDHGGFEDISPTPLPQWIENLKEAKPYPLHISYLDAWFAEWDALDLEDQLDRLEDFFSQEHRDDAFWRFAQFNGWADNWLNQLKRHPSYSEYQQRLFRLLHEVILKNPDLRPHQQSFENIWIAKLHKIFSSSDSQRFLWGEKIRNLAKRAEEFMVSSSSKEAKQRAKAFVEAWEAVRNKPSLLAYVRHYNVIPNFEMPYFRDFDLYLKKAHAGKIKFKKTPWNRFVNAALKDPTGKLLWSLLLLGIEDPRMQEHRLFQDILEQMDPISKGPTSTGLAANELVVDEDGFIVDRIDYDGESFYQIRQKWLGDATRERLRNMREWAEEASSAEELEYEKVQDAIQEMERRIGILHSILSQPDQKDKILDDLMGVLSSDSAIQRNEALVQIAIGKEYMDSHFLIREDLFINHPSLYLEVFWPYYIDSIKDIYTDPHFSKSSFPYSVESELNRLFRLAFQEKNFDREFLRAFFLLQLPIFDDPMFDERLRVRTGLSSEEYAHPEVKEQHKLSLFLINNWSHFLNQEEFLESIVKWNFLTGFPLRRKMVLERLRQDFGYALPKSFKTLEKPILHIKNLNGSKEVWEKVAFAEFLDLKTSNRLRFQSHHQVNMLLRLFSISTLRSEPNLIMEMRHAVRQSVDLAPTVSEAVDQWIAYRELQLFPFDGEAEKLFLKRLLLKINTQSTDPFNDILIILGHPRHTIMDPSMRRGFIEALAKLMFTKHGLDNQKDSRAYISKVKKDLNEIVAILNPRIFWETYQVLGNSLEWQQETLHYFFQLVEDAKHNPETAENLKTNAIVFEWANLRAQKDKEKRRDYIRFLASAGSEEDMENFGRWLRKNLDLINTEIRDFNLHIKNGSLSQFDAVSFAKGIYGEFWSQDISVRIGLLDHQLFPITEQNSAAQEKTDQDMLRFVVDLIFPKESLYSEEAREFFYAYIPSLKSNQRALFVAALLGGARKEEVDSSDARLQVGRKLSHILTLMGPVESKLSQAIHSYPETPDAIRDGMHASKSISNVPHPLARFQIIADVLPLDVRQRIRHVGKVQGAASFFLVMDVVLVDGTKAVLKILRPRSQERAAAGYQRLITMLDNLRSTLPYTTYESLMEIIQTSQNLAQKEVHTESYRDGHQALSSLLDAQIGDGQRHFQSRVVKVLEEGDGWAILEKAPGKDFLQLPLTRRRELAPALSFQFLHILLAQNSYNGMDTDRHGGQFRIHGQKIYHFDPGGLLDLKPSAEEKAIVGSIVFEIVHHMVHNQSVPPYASILAQHLQALREEGKTSAYLQGMQAAVLAASDYLQLVPPADFSFIIRDLASDIDPEIMAGFQARFLTSHADTQQKLLAYWQSNAAHTSNETPSCHRFFLRRRY